MYYIKGLYLQTYLATKKREFATPTLRAGITTIKRLLPTNDTKNDTELSKEL